MDEVIVINRETSYEVMDDSKVVRPCYYGLRILALWQPENAHCFMKAYNKFGYIVFLFSAACLCYFLTKNQQKSWSLEVTILSTLLLYGVHFIYHKWYQLYGKYDQLLRSIIRNKAEKYQYCRRLSKWYSLVAFLLWLVGLTTQILFFLNIMQESIWEYLLYLVIILYVVGWWTSWLTIYSFICHVHLMEVTEFERNLALIGARSEMPFEDLLSGFKELKDKLSKSQNFRVLISVAVFLHLADISVCTVSYFQGDYKNTSGVFKYPTICFIFSVFFDAVSIFIKLLPAAKISSALHDLTLRAGDLCMNTEKGLFDKRLFLLHQLIHISEQDMGYKILGVKITVRLTVSLLIGFISVLTTLFKFLTPHTTD